MVLKEGEQPSNLKRKKFCSRSHAASYNNSLHIKRVKFDLVFTCKRCGRVLSHGSSLCMPCLRAERFEKVWVSPIGDHLIRTASKVKYVTIRKWAKIYLDYLKVAKCCAVCGYDKIIEVCHLKPLSSFNENALMGEVNHKDNLKYLCPNHHAEFDKGLLSFPSPFDGDQPNPAWGTISALPDGLPVVESIL